MALLRIPHLWPLRESLSCWGVLCLILLCASVAQAQKPPKEEKPQVLALAPSAPGAVKVETARFGYLPVPLEERGMLSKQVEESLKRMRRLLRKRRLARITAWVGGAGDVRRVSASIREQLSDWRLPIPAITVIRVGALASPSARVALDVEVEEEKAVNPYGLIFLGGVSEQEREFQLDLRNSLERVLSTLDERLRAEGGSPATVLSARCLVSMNRDTAALDQALRQRYPAASARVMQALRTTPESFVNCEMVARNTVAPSGPLEAKIVTLVEGRPPATSLMKVNTSRLVVTSAQLCFRTTDADLALGFERLESTLEEQGTKLSNAAHLSILSQSPELGLRAEEQGRKFLHPRYDPAILRQTVESLPALDSTISLDAIVALPH